MSKYLTEDDFTVGTVISIHGELIDIVLGYEGKYVIIVTWHISNAWGIEVNRYRLTDYLGYSNVYKVLSY